MKIGTVRDISGQALNWAVAEAEGHKPPLLRILRGKVALPQEDDTMWCDYLEYSTVWEIGGPIVDKLIAAGMEVFQGNIDYANNPVVCQMPDKSFGEGKTLLIAAMRCYLCRELGTEVVVPDEVAKLR